MKFYRRKNISILATFGQTCKKTRYNVRNVPFQKCFLRKSWQNENFNESGNFLIGALKILRGGMHPATKFAYTARVSKLRTRWPEAHWTELRGKNLFHRDIHIRGFIRRIENCHNFSPTGWNRLIFIIQHLEISIQLFEEIIY